MVAVGDEGLVTGQVGLDRSQVGRRGHGPQAVAEPVLRGGGEEGRPVGGALDQVCRGGRRAVAAVGQQEGLEVRGGGPHQGRAVRDDVRHDVLVRQHHLLGGVRHAQSADDAALHHAVAVPLLVDVQAGFRIGGQDALGEPAVQGLGGLFVAGAGRGGLGQDQTHDVVRVGGL
ncbi:hypothetical protein GCM10011428_10810 [Streptomyces violaceus]